MHFSLPARPANQGRLSVAYTRNLTFMCFKLKMGAKITFNSVKISFVLVTVFDYKLLASWWRLPRNVALRGFCQLKILCQ